MTAAGAARGRDRDLGVWRPVCNTDLMDPIEAVLEQHRAIIDRVGWAVTMVGAGDRDRGFAYTVGLTALSAPEFVIAGLPSGVMQNLLNDLAVRVVSHGERFTSGQRVSGLIRGYDAIIVDGAKSSRLPTNIAYEIYGADAVTRQQVVWPDAAGRYPWDALYGYAAKVQPLIGRPRRS
jgi:hypothetical protein